MKNKILIPLLIIGALAAFFSFRYTYAGKHSSSQEKRKLVLETVMAAVQHDHFSPRSVDDTFSTRVYRKMFDYFDNGKIFFTKEDVNKLGAYEFKIDDEIKAVSLEFYDSFDAIYQRRIAEAEKYYQPILDKPFSYTVNERLQLDNKKDEYGSGEMGMKEKWRKVLKFHSLEKYVDLKDQQDKKLIDSPKIKTKTDAQFEAQAREDIKKTYQRFFKNIHKLKADDRYTTYINFIAEAEDPHTSYLPPVDKASFETMMSGSFFGIGAQLKEHPESGKITITAIVTGSPSWKQGELKAEDEIMKVAQGGNTPVDVTGFEINDVVKLIRGDKGTEVRLTIKKTDGTIKVIPILRDVVKLEETFARSAIIKSGEGKIGYIYLPEFYADFNHTSGRRCATDVYEEVRKLKSEGVNGIILDLRNNGGGSLGDVVEMSGIFVGKGPVVQVKNSNASVNILKSQITDTAIYSGPFAIMVNEGSASASEILAAAMQDYKRAIIVGAPTYGKGTVQKMVPLDEMLNPMTRIQLQNGPDSSDPTLGSLKLTMEKFYRVNGGSTQLKGVIPDIQLPDHLDYIDDEDLGERRNKSALPYDEIAPANIRPSNKITNVNELSLMSKSRVEGNQVFKLIEQTSVLRKKKLDDKSVTLNEKEYRKDQEELKALSKKIEEIQKKATTLDLISLAADKERINVDSVSINKNKEWLKNISKDIYIGETVNIVNDLSKSTMKVGLGTGY
ncbi:MAG: carboxy terminal-processing peptidase [Taibaiella sp.]|nr:carboxy terminal-processing peptidase [Taibaiella sp.]